MNHLGWSGGRHCFANPTSSAGESAVKPIDNHLCKWLTFSWAAERDATHLRAACPGHYRLHRPINRTQPAERYRQQLTACTIKCHQPVFVLPFPSWCLLASSTGWQTNKTGNKKFPSVDTSVWPRGRGPGQVFELPLATTNTTGVCSFDIVKDCDRRKPFWALRFAIASLVTFIWLGWLSYFVYSINTNRYRWCG